MDIVLYKNFSVYNKLEKNITEYKRYSGVQMIDTVNDYDVSIQFAVPTDDLKWDKVNYFQWDGAYYYLNDVDKVRNDVSVVHGTMDLLMTYKTAIKSLRVQAERSTSHGSQRLEDATRSISVDADRMTLAFPGKVSGKESDGLYILVTAQNGLS